MEQPSSDPYLLLDGQQRLTSLTAIILGKPLLVRGERKPIDIAFNVATERFEVASVRQHGAGWISLTKLFTKGVFSVVRDLGLDPDSPDAEEYWRRLQRIDEIKRYRYRVTILEHAPYDEVTRIFVRINSGGTTLGHADLALAQASARWRGVTTEFARVQRHFRERGVELDVDLFLRAIAILLTGQSRLSALFKGDRQNLTVDDLAAAWKRAQRALDQAVSFMMHNCLIDRFELLQTTNVLLPLVAYFDRSRADVSPEGARGRRATARRGGRCAPARSRTRTARG
jgi:hypothetical protein